MGVVENPSAVIHYTCPMSDCLVHVELEFGPDVKIFPGMIKKAKNNLREQIIAKHMAGEHALPRDPSKSKQPHSEPARQNTGTARIR